MTGPIKHELVRRDLYDLLLFLNTGIRYDDYM